MNDQTINPYGVYLVKDTDHKNYPEYVYWDLAGFVLSTEILPIWLYPSNFWVNDLKITSLYYLYVQPPKAFAENRAFCPSFEFNWFPEKVPFSPFKYYFGVRYCNSCFTYFKLYT